jgi:cytochrome P450
MGRVEAGTASIARSELDFDPLESACRQDPYPAYARLRQDAPVYYASRSRLWCVSRYDDVGFVLKNPDLFSSGAMQEVLMDAQTSVLTPRFLWFMTRFLWRTRINPFAVQRSGNLVTMDPPRHDRIRAIVNRGFTPRRIAAWEGRAREIVASCMRAIEVRDDFDLVDDLAIPLPVTIIAEMLGVEPERQADFKRWSDSAIAIASSASAKADPFAEGRLEHFTELFGYLRDTARARRSSPCDDLISVLVDPAQEDALEEIDVVQFVVLLLVAGNETTTNLIGNAVNALYDHPRVLEQVAADPSLVPGLIDETLRWDPPVQLVFRKATREVEVAGVPLPKGSLVAAILGSANRDPDRFEDPDRFDVTRDARGHLGFGLGVHYCLGSSLARLEARAALEALVPELPRYKPAGPRNELIDSFLIRGRHHLLLARR